MAGEILSPSGGEPHQVLPPVSSGELRPSVPVLGEPTRDNVGMTLDFVALATQTPEERKRAAVEKYWEMGGRLSEKYFIHAQEVLSYANGHPSPNNNQPLYREIFTGVMLTQQQRAVYRALRGISNIGEEIPSDEFLLAEVIFPLTGSGKRSRKRRARFESALPAHIFQHPSFRKS